MEFDVLILGAGPAGSVLAHRLASKGYRVVIVERQSFPRYRVGETLTPTVEALLKTIQVIGNSGLSIFPCTTANLSAWGSGDLYCTPHSHQSNFCGYQVDRAEFDLVLISAAQSMGASVLQPARLVEVHRENAGWRCTVRLPTGEITTVKTKFLCDATGRSRFLARRLGLRTQISGKLIGIVGYWKHGSVSKSPDDYNTLIESVPEGWVYAAALMNERRIAGFMTDRNLLPRRLHSCIRGVYNDALARTQHICHRLRGATWDGVVRVFAANPTIVDQVAGPNWLLVGDSASTLDPVSSQGVQKAITSAIAATAIVQTILTRPNDTSLAIEFYQEREEASYRSHIDSLTKLYAREVRWLDRPFWRSRASGPHRPDHASTPAHSGRDGSREGAKHPRLYNQPRFRISPYTHVVLRPVIQDDHIELQEIVVTPVEPRGLRYCGSVCVPKLLSLVKDAPDLLTIHERYQKEVGAFPVNRMRDVTFRLIELGILCDA